MSGTTNDGRVPRLRFPEFRGTGDWKQESLARFALVAMGSSPRSEYYNENRHGLPLLQGNADIKNRLSMPRIFTSEITKECHIGDILLSVRAPVGHVAKSIHHACIGRGIAAIRAKEPNLQEFLYQWLLSYEQLWASISQGGTFDAINRDDLWQLGLTIPSHAEQQKIADCLSSLDDLITLEAQKLDSLKAHKKGLMQQLFPREGETQPRLRFPEFQNAGEWQTLPLAALADKIMVGIASAATHAYRETGVIMLRNQNIKEGKIDDSSLLFIDPAYEAAHKNKRLRSGDVITVRTGYPGLSAVVTERYHNAQCFTSLITRPKKSLLDAKYLCAFINSEIGKRFVLGAEAGGAQKNVNAGVLEALPVYLPELDEQKRIASCLTSLDDLITAQTQKLEALKTHKKGLMQQLFPQVSEE